MFAFCLHCNFVSVFVYLLLQQKKKKSITEGFVICFQIFVERERREFEITIEKIKCCWEEMSSSLPMRLLPPLTTSLISPSPDSPSSFRSQNPNFSRRLSSSSSTSCSSQWQLFPGRRQRFRSYSPCIPMVFSDFLSF